MAKYLESDQFYDCLNNFFPGKADKRSIKIGIDELKEEICKLVSTLVKESENLDVQSTMEIVKMLDGPMIDCLEELNRRSWASISEVFAVLDLTESNK